MIAVVKAAKNVGALVKTAEKLEEAGIPHYLWTEQPEDIPTALATVPLLQSHGRSTKCLNKLKLFK